MAEVHRDATSQFVPDGAPVRSAAEELDIPFLCGGGGCGICRSEILEGLENLTPRSRNEEWYDKQNELGEGNRLLCQASISGGLVRIRHLGRNESLDTTDTSLAALEPGQRGVILGYEESTRETIRLGEMGFLEGSTLEVMQSGQTMLIALGASRIALPLELAAVIKIEVLKD